jgi:hypothetical protein
MSPVNPDRFNPVLIVNADTVLSAPRAAKALKAISGWNRQFAQFTDPI